MRLKFPKIIVIFSCFLSYILTCPPANSSAEPQDNEFSLTLEQVICDVIKYNPLIEEARLEWLSNFHTSQAAWGDFEPAIVFNYNENKLSRENTALQMLSQNYNPTFSERNSEYEAAIAGKFLSGASYKLGYSLKHIQNSLTTTEEYESFLGISGEQPLLKNFWFGSSTASIRITKSDYEISYNNLRKDLMQILSEAESYYWNLVFAQEQYGMATESVEIAKKLFKDSEERFKSGKISEVDFIKAQAELEIRLAQQAESYQNLIDASTQLKLLLCNPQVTGEQIIHAPESITSAFKDSYEEKRIEEILEMALKAQPDYLIRLSEVDKEKIRVAYYRSQRLPELNLTGSYGWNGLDRDRNSSWDKIKTHDFPVWTVGLKMSIPIFFGIKERNELKAARLNEEIARQRLKATEYELTRTITTLQSRVKTYRKQIDAAKKIVEFKNLILEVGLTRFETGKTDIRTVYDSEEELFEAKKNELENIIRYKEAILQLKYICGSILIEKELEEMKNNQLILSTNTIQ